MMITVRFEERVNDDLIFRGDLMELENLEFGVFKEIEPQIVEIIINEGVVLDGEKIQEIEESLLEKYDSRYALLVNRKNRYSHTHESMMKVARMKNLAAIAILARALSGIGL